jgi:hypothetical protein
VTVEGDGALHVNNPDERDQPIDALLGLLHAGGTLVPQASPRRALEQRCSCWCRWLPFVKEQ